jgi:hypothetical protein
MLQLSRKRDEILSALRHASRRPLRDEDAIWREIEAVMEAAAKEQCGWNPKAEIDRCIHALALIYACSTGAQPAFTNCDSGTRFEHFVMAIPMPVQFRITRNRIKASIRRIVPPKESGFAHRILARATPHPVS